MTATFDPKKDASNLKKHGVSLTEGDGVLSDPLAVTIEDESAEGGATLRDPGREHVRLADGCGLDTSGRRRSDHLRSETDAEGKKEL